MRRLQNLLLLVSVATATALAAENVVLDSGSRLRVERHEVVGERVRLYPSGGGSIELPAASIVRIEPDDYVSAPASVEQPVSDEPTNPAALVEEFAAALDLPPALIHSVIAAESAYDPEAVSPKGAVGLMQLMPHTARELRVENSRDPRENVRGGTTYLRRLLDRYAGTKDQLLRALAAYNAGPGTVDAYNGLPPYNETRLFVRRVIDRFLTLTEPPH